MLCNSCLAQKVLFDLAYKKVESPGQKAAPAAFKSETFREVLRPKEGLRMTVFRKVGDQK